MFRTNLFTGLAAIVLFAAAAATQKIDLPGLDGNEPIALTDTESFPVPNYTAPTLDQLRVVSYGPELSGGGAYLDLPTQYSQTSRSSQACRRCRYKLDGRSEPNYYCPNCGNRLNSRFRQVNSRGSSYSCGGCSGGGYGVRGNRAFPFWQRGLVRRVISFPFRRGCR